MPLVVFAIALKTETREVRLAALHKSVSLVDEGREGEETHVRAPRTVVR